MPFLLVLLKYVIGPLAIREFSLARERRRVKREERRRSKEVPKMWQAVVKGILRLGFIPQGWLTYLAGFATLLVGLCNALGLQSYVPSVPLPVVDNPWEAITAGATIIGLRRMLEGQVQKLIEKTATKIP
jgi:hypothetical protein